MSEGAYFSVKVMRNDGTPAKDVGVIIVYSGLLKTLLLKKERILMVGLNFITIIISRV